MKSAVLDWLRGRGDRRHRLWAKAGRRGRPDDARGMLVAAVGGLRVFVAWLAIKAGSAPIVGAFAAGIASRAPTGGTTSTRRSSRRGHLRPGLFHLRGCQVDVRLLESRGRREPSRAAARPGPDPRRLSRKARRRLLRLGQGAPGLHRRRDGAPGRGRPSIPEAIAPEKIEGVRRVRPPRDRASARDDGPQRSPRRTKCPLRPPVFPTRRSRRVLFRGRPPWTCRRG